MTPSHRRLFFALWPDPATRIALQRWQALLTSPGLALTHPADLHLTLHFLGQVEERRLEQLLSMGDGLSSPAFPLVLDHLGVFSDAKVLWAGPRQVTEGLSELHAALAGQLSGLGFTLERRAYRPHLTLARKYAGMPPRLKVGPIAWTARRWGLLESRPGRRPLYRPLRLWKLG